jgi:hypothetical protein
MNHFAWAIVPSPENGSKSLTAHSTDQQPFLAVAQQLLGPIRKAAVHKKILCPCLILGIYQKANPYVMAV